MITEESNWDTRQTRESTPVDAEPDGPWDDWEALGSELSGDDLWDAFELDDELEEPEPEHGDFWPEIDDEEGLGA
jgi:hypothetical protein